MKLAVRPDTINKDETVFAHTIDLPTGETVEGRWDLRGDTDALLGGVDFSGKSALDIYCATGFMTWEMERRGASVLSFDMAEPKDRDIIPDARSDYADKALQNRTAIDYRHNGFWYCHQALDSKASVMHGNLYELPVEVGPVDVSVFGLVLSSIRDPFYALHNAARLTKDRIVIVERSHPSWRDRRSKLAATATLMAKTPDQSKSGLWWALPPPLIAQMLGVLGFQKTTETAHQHLHGGREADTYTLVAERTEEFNPLMDY